MIKIIRLITQVTNRKPFCVKIYKKSSLGLLYNLETTFFSSNSIFFYNSSDLRFNVGLQTRKN